VLLAIEYPDVATGTHFRHPLLVRLDLRHGKQLIFGTMKNDSWGRVRFNVEQG
jgi:hypothetical protein